jgi:uncharacterized protein (DUF1800 family)
MDLTMIDAKWAWSAYSPTPDNPWDLKKAGHLHRRAGFGATWEELQATLRLGAQASVDRVLKGGTASDEFTKTAEIMNRSARQTIAQARGWWVLRMLQGPHPLREKMALFWHNHFATSNAKVQNTARMFGQYELMYSHALGSFAELLQAMSKDPAMMVWLDTVQSKKGQPNENYARELMELFSLGIGHYTEKDIREAARAFTGWEIRGEKWFFNPGQYDAGEKEVIGRKGKFKGEDIVGICLDQPACPRFIVRKLLRFLVSDTLDLTPELVEPLATQFRDSKFDFGKLVETVLRSNLFFSPHAYRQQIKSPVDFALGTVRGLEILVSATNLAGAMETLGQNLFHPPSVKGWDGGQAWLNGQTLLFRQNMALALSSRDTSQYLRLPGPDVIAEPADLLRKHGKLDEVSAVDFLLDLFMQRDVPTESREKLVDYLRQARKQSLPKSWSAADQEKYPTRAVTHLVLTLPEYQLN